MNISAALPSRDLMATVLAARSAVSGTGAAAAAMVSQAADGQAASMAAISSGTLDVYL